MSVVKSKRNPSRFEVIKHAVDLRISLTGLVVRNFGIKNLDTIPRKKYRFGKEQDDLPKYRFILLDAKRQINQLTTLLDVNIKGANTISPSNYGEFIKRRDYQNSALVICEQIYSQLQYIVTMFEVDINRFRQYIEALDYQIKLIKEWRQSDNRKYRRILSMGDI